MKLTALILANLMLSTLAQAAARPQLAPSPGEASTCFKREYTADYLRRNPKPKLEAMFVKLGWRNEQNEYEKWSWIAGEVVGVSLGDYYGNTAGCTASKDGSVSCMIECDGGSFSLRHSPRYTGAVNFLVTKDYYFPLFKNHMSRDDTEEQIEVLNLEGDANRIFRLQPVPAQECDEAIKRVQVQGMGGC
jgi:hypothetical protein